VEAIACDGVEVATNDVILTVDKRADSIDDREDGYFGGAELAEGSTLA
jgi:hypothetical protein